MWIIIVIVVVLVFLAALILVGNSIIDLSFKEQNKENDWDIAEDNLKNPEGFRFVDEEHHDEIVKSIDWFVHQNYEKITITSFDGLKLTGRYLDNPEHKGIILMVHGYQSWAAYDFSISSKYFYDMGYSYLAIDQRAHNDSEGTYITFGVNERYDVKSWAEKLCELYPDIPIILCGVSMGAATVMMASGLELPSSVKAIIADCGYTTPKEEFKHVIQERALLLTNPIISMLSLLLKIKAKVAINSCDTRVELKKNKLPILIIHGKADTYVPCFMSQENYKAAKESADAKLLLVDDAIHAKSFLVDRETYLNEVKELLSKV